MNLRSVVLMIAAAILAAGLVGCGGGGGGGAGVTVAAITDSDGKRLPSTIDVNEQNPSGLSEISGLQPGQRIEVMLFKDGAPQYEQPLMFTADNNGVVPLVLFYDLGINPNTGQIDPSAAGNYTVEITSNGRTIGTHSFSLTGSPAQALSRATGPGSIAILTGTGGTPVFAMGSIESGQPIKVWGRNLQSGDRYALYVVSDRNDWAVGDSYSDVSGQVEIATVTEGWFIVTVWEQANSVGGERDFDIIAKKLNPDETPSTNSVLTADDVVEAKTITGFTVQDAAPGGDRILALASDGSGAHSSMFQAGDDLYCWVNPPWRPSSGVYGTVVRYVTLHQQSWNNGARLIDASGRPEFGVARRGCTNMGNTCIWTNIPAGKYDIIIDVDLDGLYDTGVDLIDNDVTVAGTITAQMAVGSERSLVARSEPVSVYAKLVWSDGLPVSGKTVAFAIRSGAGTLSASTATTDENGQASVIVTPTARGAELVISASATVKGPDEKEYPLTGECYIATKAAGDMAVIIK